MFGRRMVKDMSSKVEKGEKVEKAKKAEKVEKVTAKAKAKARAEPLQAVVAKVNAQMARRRFTTRVRTW